LEIQSAIADTLDHGLHCLIYSMDLSAAFDLIRPDIFYAKLCKQGKVPRQLCNLLMDMISERKAYVEIDEQRSTTIDFKVGCPQGLTLGPKVFNLYCHDLADALGEVTLVSYADDSYVIVSDPSVQGLLNKQK